MYVRVGGSIQTAVPVNPVWPTEFTGKNGDISPENDDDTSQPSVRTPSGWGERCHINWTVDALRTRLPSRDLKSTRLNSSHTVISYAVFCLKKKNKEMTP